MENKLNNLVKEKGLCPKLLGLEKGTGACFSYQLGYCKGACCRKISPQEYNQLLNTAISKIKIQNWPFKGKKIITEVINKKRETLTFNNWGLVGSSVKDPIYEESNKSKFDIDTYKILIRYLKSQKKISLE